ncbi:hypothetical protein ABIB25_002002 [Nakamurella sp. UYEF19]|uniref:hypothetical protein n=1 Tax=Nakamurella sp. UYEF19 TaxID=1756392 RepID=UPI0033959EB3
MSALPPDDPDPTDRERSAAEVDAEFAAIISGISGQMSWDAPSVTDRPPIDRRRVATDDRPTDERPPTAVSDSQDAADERERRRQLRRAQRAEEVALFEASQAELAAEMQADDAHFIPPEPPPVPKPRRRTVVALIFLALGLVMLIRPSLVEVAPDVVLFLGIGCLIGGFGMLIHGLRPRASDPDDADGWDDGARL